MPVSKGQKKDEVINAETLDSFVNGLMAPSNGEKKEREVGDVTPYEAIEPGDIYTANELLLMLHTPSARKNLDRVRNLSEFYTLLVGDMLINSVEPGEMRNRMESALAKESTSLQLNLEETARIYCSSRSPEEAEAQMGKIRSYFEKGYLNENRKRILGLIDTDEMINSELKRQINNKTRITKTIATLVCIAVLAANAYFSYTHYDRERALQRQYGGYAESVFGIEMPESFYHIFKGVP